MMKRRHFLATTGLATVPTLLHSETASRPEEIIDIHQHVNYSGRLDPDLLRHQDAMGVTRTVLLPSGTELTRASTHMGKSNGLAARIFGTAAAARIAALHPDRYVYFANEVPDIPEARKTLEEWLKKGALGIGEQKFNIACDSEPMQDVYRIARDHNVPVLLHFQHETYNLGFERFHTMLEKFPTVNFIGHAQTWWGYIDKAYKPEELYPKTSVTPGGLSDRWLAEYPNMFGDLSAGSGQNALTRDREQAIAFLDRHQDKLLLGTDCNDSEGKGAACSGAGTIALIRQLVPEPATRAKIFSGNARKIIRLD